VDSRDVTKEIRRLVWPELREHGFEAFTGRTAWRYVDNAVDIVNFQSFGASIADAVGCTTFSFSVNTGVWLPQDAWTRDPRRDPKGRVRPAEYECDPHRRRLNNEQVARAAVVQALQRQHARLAAFAATAQKRAEEGDPQGRSRPARHLVRAPDGSNLRECILNALRVIREQALPWFELTRTRATSSPRSREV
jgi:hypothetical protein